MATDQKSLLSAVLQDVGNELGTQPANVKAQRTRGVAYYKRRLLQVLKGQFILNVPEEWDEDYLLDNLLIEGKVVVTDTDAGILPLRAGISGFNVFGKPADEPALHKVCHPVTRFDEKLHLLLDDMAQTLTDANGVGLAAPQIGIMRRIFIMDIGDEIVELINPEILETGGEQD